MYPDRGNDAIKCESQNHSSGSSPKMRLPPKCANADTRPDWNKRILRHPRAKIIASRLHLLIFFLRMITSDKTSIEYWHQYQSQQAMSSIMLHAARCDYTIRRHLQGMAQGMGLRNLFSYRTARPPPPSPMHPCAAAPNAETPPPIKTRILYVNKNLLTEQAKFKLI